MHRLRSPGEPWGSKMLYILVKRAFLVSALSTNTLGNRELFSSLVSRHIVGGLNEGFPKVPCQFFALGCSNTSSIRMPSKLLVHILNIWISYVYQCLNVPFSFGYFHRYPKDSEKLKLARQTGLTRNQVMSLILNQKLDFSPTKLKRLLANLNDICVYILISLVSFRLGRKLVYKCTCSAMETNGRGDVQRRIWRLQH